MELSRAQVRINWKPLLIGSAILIVYGSVMFGLFKHWWNDDNYSHGLLVPFIAGFIIWQQIDRLLNLSRYPEFAIGMILIIAGLLMLLIGTLGSELFIQRVSLVILLAGMAVCFFSRRVLFFLAAPFALLLFAIPIPQIVFNKVAFPLQLLATRAANAALVFFGIPSQRNGNVIHLLSVNGSKVALEVAEACSGIRSLMLLLSLAVLFAYFTSEKGHGSVKTVREIFKDPNLWRTLILLLFMVPVALLTNATRVILTGIAAHYYGQEVLDSWWHDAFGWLSFGVAVLLLIAFNWGLTKIRILNGINFDSSTIEDHRTSVVVRTIKNGQIVTLVTMLVATGLLINYLQHRTPPAVERLSFSEFPSNISGAVRMRPDVRFDAETERVLGASDYIMRNYIEPPRKFNLYIGFYEAQKTGSTYHSPQNCLPGSGWVLSEGRDVQIRTTDGESFTAKQYVVQQRDNRQVMLYWYQGRGRTNSSEYSDKFYTILDSVRTGRTDGSMVRILTPVYADETDVDAEGAAKRFAANVYEVLSPFVPE